MGIQIKEQEAPRKNTAASQTRGTPAFAVLKPVRQSSKTEADVGSYFWPNGIDYSMVGLPQVSPLEDSSDRLEIIELLDD